MKIDDGGPAFPPTIGPRPSGELDCFNGMSRRDWLIGLFIKGILSNSNFMDPEIAVDIAEGKGDCENICMIAERLADTAIAKSKEEK